MKAPMNEGEVDDLDLLLGQLEDYAFLGKDDLVPQIDKHSKNTATYRDRSPTRDVTDYSPVDDDLQLLQYRSESREELKAGYNNDVLNIEYRQVLPDEDVQMGTNGQDNQEIKFNDILQWVWSTQQQLQTVHLGDVPSTAAATGPIPQQPLHVWKTEPVSPPVTNLMLPPNEPRSYSSARSDRSYTSIATIPSTSDFSVATLPSRTPSVSSFTLSDKQYSRPPSEKTSRPSSRRASPVRSRGASRASSPRFSRNNSPTRRCSSTKSPRQISSRGSSPCKRRSQGYDGASSTIITKPTHVEPRSRQSSVSNSIDVKASSADKPSSSTEVTPAKLPRYKRPSHINAEHKRRGKIKKGFVDLVGLIPTINSNGKDTKAIMLTKCADYLRAMKTDCKRQNKDVDALRAEVEELNVQVAKFQEELPESGADVALPANDVETASLDDLFNEYVERETKKNWKFWIFSLLIRPLFESYKVFVNGEIKSEAFFEAVNDWVKKHCSLTNLRPAALKSLRHLSKVSSVMTNPEKLPEDAMNAVTRVKRGAANTDISDEKS